jgi:hypothetical protein
MAASKSLREVGVAVTATSVPLRLKMHPEGRAADYMEKIHGFSFAAILLTDS